MKRLPRRRSPANSLAAQLVFPLAVVALCCAPESPDYSTILFADDLSIRVLAEPLPPHVRDVVRYKVIVRDARTGEPIEGGSGALFATGLDLASYSDTLVPGAELGSYYANMRFITPGPWAIAIRFRRDSTKSPVRADWMQDVRRDTVGSGR